MDGGEGRTRRLGPERSQGRPKGFQGQRKERLGKTECKFETRKELQTTLVNHSVSLLVSESISEG